MSFKCTVKWVSYTYTCIHSFSHSFPIQVTTEHWVEFLLLHGRFLLVIYLKLILDFYFISPPTFPFHNPNIWNLKKNDTNELINKTETDSQIWGKNLWYLVTAELANQYRSDKPSLWVVDLWDSSLTPESGRSPGKRNGNPLQYSCLEKFHGQRSLAGCSPWGYKEADMMELLSMAQPGYCRMFSNTPGLYPLDATSTFFYQLW